MRKKVEAAILVGGKSKRIGTNKSFLHFKNSCMLDAVHSRLRCVFDEIFLVANASFPCNNINIRCISDVFPEKGPLGGIYTALEHANSDYVFVFACDMPFLSTQLITWMIDRVEGSYDVVAPFFRGRAEPLHALYSKSAAEKIRNAINKSELSVHVLLEKLSTQYISEEEIAPFGDNMFFNINTPGDYEKALAMLENVKN